MTYDYNGGLPMKLSVGIHQIIDNPHPNLSQTINDSGVYERVGWTLHSS